jgi:hypothetical protein
MPTPVPAAVPLGIMYPFPALNTFDTPSYPAAREALPPWTYYQASSMEILLNKVPAIWTSICDLFDTFFPNFRPFSRHLFKSMM